MNKKIAFGFIFFSSFLLPQSMYAADTYVEIVKSVKELCNAPTDKKSSFYKVTAKGKVDFRIKILGLAGADAVFNRKEWEGVQRVLQKDQLKDNEGYRKCTMSLTPMFMKKFKNGVQAEKERKEFIKNNSSSQKTYGDKSPIINNPTGPITIQ